MSKKIYVEEKSARSGFYRNIVLLILLIILAIVVGNSGLLIAIFVIVAIVCAIVFSKTPRKINRYKRKNPELVEIINKSTVNLKIYLDEENKIMYLFANDRKGIIISVPFADFVKYQIFYDVKDSIAQHNVIEITTSLSDPNLSIINLECNGGNVAETEKLLAYFIAQWEKGKYDE